MSSKDWIGYQNLVDNAHRGIVRDILRHVAKGGTMGNHHFFITFDTQAPGVVISDVMKGLYPEQITIVLQNQFWDLKVFDDAFEVGLSFNKMPEVLHVPYAAIRQFVDPSQNFGFTLRPPEGQATAPKAAMPAPAPKPEAAKPDDEPPGDDTPSHPTVVSLDRFRKK